MLHSVNPKTGLLKVNNVSITPLTASQSGFEGTITFPGEEFGRSFGKWS
jgi:hypothetical protein